MRTDKSFIVGIGAGIAIGVALYNIEIGIALGLALGVVFSKGQTSCKKSILK